MRTDTIKFLTLQETTRLFHRLASYRREKAIFLLAYRHGLRASEVGMLRIEDISNVRIRCTFSLSGSALCSVRMAIAGKVFTNPMSTQVISTLSDSLRSSRRA